MSGTTNSFAIEGGVCSGKTTAIRKLAEHIALTVIPDYMAFFPKAEHEALASTGLDYTLPLLIEAEARRAALYREASRVVCFDRSVLTLIAFRYACLRLGLIKEKNLIINQLESASFIVPMKIIHLIVSHEERMRRLIRRGDKAMPNIYITEEFNTLLDEFYFKITKDIPVLTINTDKYSEDKIGHRILDALSHAELVPNNIVELSIRYL